MVGLILFFIACILAIVPVIFYYIRKGRSEALVYIAPVLWLRAFSSLYEFFISFLLRVDSSIWFMLYPVLEFLVMYYFFQKLFGEKHKGIINKFLIGFLLATVVLLAIWLYTGMSQTDSVLTILQTIFIYMMAFLWFKEIFSEMKLASLWDSPAFYFISGFIMYFSGTFFLFVMTDIVFTEKEMNQYWIINVILSLLLNITLSIGVWKGQNKSIRYSG